MIQNTFTLQNDLLQVSLTDSRDHEQAQGLGGVVGLLEMEKLKFQDPGKRSLDR